MVTIFVGGHGRCDEGEANIAVPKDIELYWFGLPGNPVTKAFSSAVLKGELTTMSGMNSRSAPPCQHYCCDSLSMECQIRADAFQSGPWDTDTWFVQARPGFSVSLTQLMSWSGTRWGGQKKSLKWAVCRSSVKYSGLVIHDFNKETARAVDGVRDRTGPSERPDNRAIDNIEGLIFVEQWTGAKISRMDYGSVTTTQAKKVGLTIHKNVKGYAELDMPEKKKNYSNAYF
jgi:hypothetical protein